MYSVSVLKSIPHKVSTRVVKYPLSTLSPPESYQPVNYLGHLRSRQETLNLLLVTRIRHICPAVRRDWQRQREDATRIRTDQGQWPSGLPLPAFSCQLFTCCGWGGGILCPLSHYGCVTRIDEWRLDLRYWYCHGYYNKSPFRIAKEHRDFGPLLPL